MSFLTSTGLARPKYVIGVVGITGQLGRAIAPIFLEDYKPFFSSVVGLVRNPTSDAAKALADAGVELRQVSASDSADTVANTLRGIDILVNVLNTDAAAFKDVVAEAAVKAGVSVYFLSEFGVDHSLNKFDGYDNYDWIHKRESEALARKLAGDKVKVISIYNSAFLEGAIGPWFGFDTGNKTYTAIGDPKARLSFTSKSDIGRVIAELSILSLGPSSNTVPDRVRIAGDTVSIEGVATALRKVRKELGIDDIEIAIKSEDLDAFRIKTKERQLAHPKSDPVWHIRILVGENKLDFSADNSNELINPGEKVWKWKTLEDYFREIGGKPFGA